MRAGEISSIKSTLTERVMAAAVSLTAAAGAFVVGYFNPVTAGFFPVCPLFQLTGLHCPGCGLTRGFHALFHGDVLGALHFNALLPIYLFVFVYLFVSLILIALRGRGLSLNILHPYLLIGFFAIAIVFGIVRNFSVYPFTLLAP